MKIVRFLKIYFVFVSIALLINLSIEMLIPTPEQKNAIGIIMFYIIFSFIGSSVFFFKNYTYRRMGLLSLLLGFIFEFTFMRPAWVYDIFALKITFGVILTVIISALYWFIPWGVPAYIIHRYLSKQLIS